MPSVQHCRSDCISFSASAPQLLHETSELHCLLLISTIVQILDAVSPLRFLVVSVLSDLISVQNHVTFHIVKVIAAVLLVTFLLLFRLMRHF